MQLLCWLCTLARHASAMARISALLPGACAIPNSRGMRPRLMSLCCIVSMCTGLCLWISHSLITDKAACRISRLPCLYIRMTLMPALRWRRSPSNKEWLYGASSPSDSSICPVSSLYTRVSASCAMVRCDCPSSCSQASQYDKQAHPFVNTADAVAIQQMQALQMQALQMQVHKQIKQMVLLMQCPSVP